MLSNIQNLRQIGDLPKRKVTPEAEVPALFLLYINIIYTIHVYSYHLHYKFCKYLYNKKKIQLSDVTQCHVPTQKKLHYQRISTKYFWKRKKKKKTTHHNLSSWSSFCRISEQSIPILSLVQLKYAELQIPSYFLFMYCVCLPSGNQIDACLLRVQILILDLATINKKLIHWPELG